MLWWRWLCVQFLLPFHFIVRTQLHVRTSSVKLFDHPRFLCTYWHFEMNSCWFNSPLLIANRSMNKIHSNYFWFCTQNSWSLDPKIFGVFVLFIVASMPRNSVYWIVTFINCLPFLLLLVQKTFDENGNCFFVGNSLGLCFNLIG